MQVALRLSTGEVAALARTCVCMRVEHPAGERYGYFPVAPAAQSATEYRGYLPVETTASLSSRQPSGGWAPPFISGRFELLTYEYAARLHPSLRLPPSAIGLPERLTLPVAAVLVVDPRTGEATPYGRDAVAERRLLAYVDAVTSTPNVRTSARAQVPDAQIALKERQSTAYTAAVQTTIDRILAGDLFQANITRRIEAHWPGATYDDALAFAAHFVTEARAPFGAVVPLDECVIASASPERFFRAEQTPRGTKIIAEPIKGTRPRSSDPIEDARLAAELLGSEKDRAENIMIADLVRNDLSKVCTDESVTVEALCELQSNETVHHLVTRVSGILRPGLTVEDALLAQFPCGSITGAPKLAAMDLIAELEGEGRGIYCGAIGYLDDRGHADFSVAIRTAVARVDKRGVTLSYGTGGGITTLSDPQEEYAETVDKAAGFLRALPS